VILHIERLREVAGIRYDQHDLPVRGEKGYIRQLLQIIGPNPHRTGPHKFRKVLERVVSQIASYLVAVESDRTLAHRASAVIGVRPIIRVGGKVPEKYVAAPVPCCSDQYPSDGFSNIEWSITTGTRHRLLRHV